MTLTVVIFISRIFITANTVTLHVSHWSNTRQCNRFVIMSSVIQYSSLIIANIISWLPVSWAQVTVGLSLPRIATVVRVYSQKLHTAGYVPKNTDPNPKPMLTE